jgi:hypothetical protein
MASYLLSIGFVEAKSDTSLFIYRCRSDTSYLLLYVDDIVLTASSPGLLRRIISALQREFAMKDLGELHHLVCMFSALVMVFFFLSDSTCRIS